MKRIAIAGVLVALVLISFGCDQTGTASDQPAGGAVSSDGETKRPGFPSRIGSTTVGRTGEEVVAAFGPGLRKSSDGDGERHHYYVRSDESATLHVVVSADGRLSVVELMRNVALPPQLGDIASSRSKAFDAAPPTWNDLGLDAGYSEVVSSFGRPDSLRESGSMRTLKYYPGADSGSATFTVILSGDQVSSIGIYTSG